MTMMMMDERLQQSPFAARTLAQHHQQQLPGNPARVHSIEAILGFKEDLLFHRSTACSLAAKVGGKDAQEQRRVRQSHKSHFAESLDGTFDRIGFVVGLIVFALLDLMLFLLYFIQSMICILRNYFVPFSIIPCFSSIKVGCISFDHFICSIDMFLISFISFLLRKYFSFHVVYFDLFKCFFLYFTT